MKRKLVLALMSCVAAGCASPSQQTGPGSPSSGVLVQSGKAFDLAVGGQANVEGAAITVRFTGVSQDSRCPSDVQCVWAGNATLKLTLTGPRDARSDVTLNTLTEPRAVSFSGHRVSLIGLKPTPQSGTSIPPLSYVASFEVARVP